MSVIERMLAAGGVLVKSVNVDMALLLYDNSTRWHAARGGIPHDCIAHIPCSCCWGACSFPHRWHDRDIGVLPDEAGFIEDLQRREIPSDFCMWPNGESLGEHGSDAFKAKWKSGPWGTLNVLSGQPNFIRNFAGSLCINILVAFGIAVVIGLAAGGADASACDCAVLQIMLPACVAAAAAAQVLVLWAMWPTSSGLAKFEANRASYAAIGDNSTRLSSLQCVGHKPEASKSCVLCAYHIILIGIRSRRQLFAAGLLWMRAEPISGPCGQYSNAKLDNHTLIYDSIGPMLSRLPMTNLRNGMNAQKSPTPDGLPQPRRTLK